MYAIVRTVRSSTVAAFIRPFAAGAGTTPPQQQTTSTTRPDQKTDDDKYTYLPPGCSLKEPMYVSIGDPVYYYDPPANAGSNSQKDASPDGKSQTR